MMGILDKLQSILSYDGCESFQFRGDGTGKIGTTGFLLGFVGGLHVAFMLMSILILMSGVALTAEFVSRVETLMHWSTYMTCLCTFHFLEFFLTAISQPYLLSYESFIINHSKAYTIALLASMTEFWLEYLIFPKLKLNYAVAGTGLALMGAGQMIRSLAMWTCGPHFSHIIMQKKQPDHRLITAGIYSVLRHPAYFGWFYWSIGTQLLLCNPICIIAYTGASWSFFNARIPHEENLLLKFYPAEYPEYLRRTYIGIPFITSEAPAKEKKEE